MKKAIIIILLVISLVLVGCCPSDKYSGEELIKYYNQFDTFSNLSCNELFDAFEEKEWYIEYDKKYGSKWCYECTPSMFGGTKFLCGTYHDRTEILNRLLLKDCYAKVKEGVYEN